MPEICRFYGIIIKMYFNEHNPPHFHTEYEGYKVTITIEAGILEGKMPKRALNLIFEWLEIHHEELMNNWILIEELGEYSKIKPLE